METPHATAEAATPNATDSPKTVDLGVVKICVGDQNVLISEVEHWVEDGLHVFRSTEFDCQSEHEDEGEALFAFLQSAEDLLRFLDDLVDADRATRDEIRIMAKLSRRFYEVYAAQREELERRQRRRLLRSHSGMHSVNWRRRQTPTNSSRPVPA